MAQDVNGLSERLLGAPLFQGFSREDLCGLLESMVREEFAADEVILRQDTFTRNLWLLIEGNCEVVKLPPIGEYGQPVNLACLNPLDVFGEISLLLHKPHVASVEAKTRVQALRMRGEDFDSLADRRSPLACQLLHNLLRIQSGRLRGVAGAMGRYLDQHETLEAEDDWNDIQKRLARLYS